MENFNLWRSLTRQWLVVLVIIAVTVAAAWWVYGHQAASASGSMSITIQTSRNYPAVSQLILQSDSSSEVQTMVATTQAWISDPSYIKNVLDKARVSQSDTSLRGLSKTFKIIAAGQSSSSYQVQYEGKNQEEVDRVYTALKEELAGLRDLYNRNENNSIKVTLLFSEPVVTDQSSAVPLTPIAGLAVGIILALVAAVLLDRKNS